MKIAFIAMLVGLFTVATTVSANQAASNTKGVKVANADHKKKSKKTTKKEETTETKTETTAPTPAPEAPAK